MHDVKRKTFFKCDLSWEVFFACCRLFIEVKKMYIQGLITYTNRLSKEFFSFNEEIEDIPSFIKKKFSNKKNIKYISVYLEDGTILILNI